MRRIIRYKKYTAAEGDTFDLLAMAMYHDERQTSVIAEFNPDWADYIVLPAGAAIKLPYLEDTYDGATLPPWRRAEEQSELVLSDGEVIA